MKSSYLTVKIVNAECCVPEMGAHLTALLVGVHSESESIILSAFLYIHLHSSSAWKMFSISACL